MSHRGKILATVCIAALTIARTLFIEEAYRAASCLLCFVTALAECEDAFSTCAPRAAVEDFNDLSARCDSPLAARRSCTLLSLPLRACDAVLAPSCRPRALRRPRPRVRTELTSRTGSDTCSLRPRLTAPAFRWFHLRRSSTDTLKRSATVTSVSPRRTV